MGLRTNLAHSRKFIVVVIVIVVHTNSIEEKYFSEHEGVGENAKDGGGGPMT